MIFNQKKDGSCDLVFNDKEIEVLVKYKKLHLSPEFVKHFSNTLIKIVVDLTTNLDDETSSLQSQEFMDIKSTKPKDV
tara:strand:+ start:3477 stop:3710 length:234 start_codon:yes stop_codon:yes gene_type:complete